MPAFLPWAALPEQSTQPACRPRILPAPLRPSESTSVPPSATRRPIIRKGENISAREVEDLLVVHPDVAEVAVIGVPDPETGERICAVIRPRPGSTPTLDALVDFLRTRGLSTHKLPERLELTTDFPRTASGKIQKVRLRERLD